MKKRLLIYTTILLTTFSFPVMAQEGEKEILFRDVPWGTSYTEANSLLSDLDLWNLSGEAFQTKSIDDITLGDYKGIDFEYTDINIIANAMNGEVEVAGYTTDSVELDFAYVPNNGVLNKTEDESALYGAQYTFLPRNLSEMSADLINKLSSLYGEPSETKNDSDWLGLKYTYTFWKGANDTEVVLRTQDASADMTDLYDDEIVISYVWLKGDELLQAASDTLAGTANANESAVYGNDLTNGL